MKLKFCSFVGREVYYDFSFSAYLGTSEILGKKEQLKPEIPSNTQNLHFNSLTELLYEVTLEPTPTW